METNDERHARLVERTFRIRENRYGGGRWEELTDEEVDEVLEYYQE